MIEALFGSEFSEVVGIAFEVLRDPASDTIAASLLLAIVSLALIMLVLGIVMVMLPSRRPSSPALDRTSGSDTGASADSDAPRPAGRTRGAPAAWVTAALVVVLVALVWVVAGYVTARPDVCLSCHDDVAHAVALADEEAEVGDSGDPHRETRCVSCHETGGLVGSLTWFVPLRAVHLVEGLWEPARVASGYGDRISSASCAKCHAADIDGTVTVEERGVLVSHAEPLDAGADCLDCHRPVAGVVSDLTVGMSACLRCHDDETSSAACDTCHTGEVASAVRISKMDRFREPRALIGQPTCGGCHDETSCDNCHGVRLPHSAEFRALGHARPGVEDIWYNGGRTCSKCHTESRRPCTECHQKMPSHGLDWERFHRGSPEGCSCHARTAHLYGRNICELCHETGRGR